MSVLAGCGAGTVAIDGGSSAVVLQGVVHGGQQPVQGAIVEYFATTSGGYNGTVSPIGSGTTAPDGSFAINVTGTCPSGQYGYLLVTGGNPGTTVGTNNTALVEAAAIGSCSSITGSTIVTVNEVTTIAFAYALSGFLPAGGTGMSYSAISGGGGMPGVTTSSTNAQGLTDAFANAANIVNVTTGTAYTTNPGGNGTVPQATIYALADILQDCVNSDGSLTPATTACSKLIAAATPPYTGATAPGNTLQAAVDIAQYPGGSNVPTLYGLISSQSAFVATTPMSAAPNDWTVAVTYTYPSSALVLGLGMGIDNYDNVYVSGSTAAATGTDLLLMSPQGVLLSSALMPTTKTSHNLRWVAFDKSNNAYLTDGSSAQIYQFSPTTPSNPAAGGAVISPVYSGTPVTTANNYALAVDQYGDVFVDTYKKSSCTGSTGSSACILLEYLPSSFATTSPTTPAVTFGSFQDVQPGVGGARGVAFDVNRNYLWTTDITGNTVNVFPLTPSKTGVATASAAPLHFTLGTPSVPVTSGYGTVAVAVDASGNAWSVVTGGPAVTSGTVTTAVQAALYQVTPTGTITTIAGPAATAGGLSAPSYDVIDGNGNIFIANTIGGSSPSAIEEYSPSVGAYVSSGYGLAPGGKYTAGSGSTAATLTGGSLYGVSYVAVDKAGALWALSGGSNSGSSLANLVQILGVAAPANPVQAAGQYGVKP